MNYFDKLIFGIYPYIVMGIFIVGCLVRFEREQYSWKSESSQLLYAGRLRLGNILFHIGVLGLFFGHLVGLLTPVVVWDTLGVSHSFKQLVAMTAGGIMGTMCLVGLIILIHRRFSCDRLLANSTWRDKLVLIWLLITLLLGLTTILASAQHRDGHEMVMLMTWAQHIVTFRGGAVEYIAGASLIFKIHMFMGMSLFAIFPFTRLVHIFSGFATVTYIVRAWQLVRPRA